MPPLVVTAPEPLSGKTAVAVGLGQRLSREGQRVALLRLAGDEHAAQDAALFASLPFNAERRAQPLEPAQAAAKADYVLVEVPSGDPFAALSALKARAVAVVRYGSDALTFSQTLGKALAGLVVTCVPAARLEATRQSLAEAGLPVLALVAEDRTLAAPTLEAAVAALEGGATYFEDNRQRVLDRPLISSISADPGQGYFASYEPSAVIVRGDKPDLQLAALNAGAPCLIVTRGLPPLSYVLDRAEQEEVPIVQTPLDTLGAVERLESLYAATPFAGPAKVERIAELLAEADLSALAAKK